MDFVWEPEYAQFRAGLRAFVREWRTPELLREYAESYGAPGPRIRAFHRALDERGWMRMCWPKEVGGGGRSMLFHYLFVEEMEYWGMPYGNLTYTSIGTMKSEIPWWRGTSGSVRAASHTCVAVSASDVQIFCPEMIQPSPSRTARVRSAARSVPASGSE